MFNRYFSNYFLPQLESSFLHQIRICYSFPFTLVEVSAFWLPSNVPFLFSPTTLNQSWSVPLHWTIRMLQMDPPLLTFKIFSKPTVMFSLAFLYFSFSTPKLLSPWSFSLDTPREYITLSALPSTLSTPLILEVGLHKSRARSLLSLTTFSPSLPYFLHRSKLSSNNFWIAVCQTR